MADPLTPAGKNRVRDLRKSLKLQIWKCPKTNEWENSKKNMIQNKGWSLKTMISKVGISCFGCRRSSAGSIFVGVCMSQFSKVAAQLRSFGSWSLFLWRKRMPTNGENKIPTLFSGGYSDVHYNIILLCHNLAHQLNFPHWLPMKSQEVIPLEISERFPLEVCWATKDPPWLGRFILQVRVYDAAPKSSFSMIIIS